MTVALAIALGLQTVRIAFLRHEHWLRTEMRVRLNAGKVQQYAHEKKAFAHFPPPVAFIDDEEIYRTGDGFHRIEAEHENGAFEMVVDVRRGGVKEAILWNLKANRDSQGMLFAPGDKGKAVRRMLLEPYFKGWSNRQIAETVGCDRSEISRQRRKLGIPINTTAGRRRDISARTVAELSDKGFSQGRIARELKISPRTVRSRIINGDPKRLVRKRCPHCHGTGYISQSAGEPADA